MSLEQRGCMKLDGHCTCRRQGKGGGERAAQQQEQSSLLPPVLHHPRPLPLLAQRDPSPSRPGARLCLLSDERRAPR